MKPLELWGGAEATVNRIGDQYFDQMRRSKHWDRIEDLDLFAGMGLTALRHPLLWELIAPEGLGTADWSWFDRRFERLRELNLRPIAGLVHHGSGPRSTSLVDDGFAPGLERFARACAERYPWVCDWTPINEPLTTARFSALYGVWYPHAKDDALFCKALVNECKATVLAMQQIRQVNPAARLVQTEDLGLVSFTETVKSSGEFQNLRRWLSFDLLCGKVNEQHPFWKWLQKGVSWKDLAFFLEHPCPPDVMGINYYITSDRTLDDRLERYPIEYHGGDDRYRFADVESVRTEFGIAGHEQILRQAWERYHLPLAITEVHLDCTRDEQLRWLKQAWTAANAVRADGIDVRAITLWALLGSFDWNTLLTASNGYYEPGAFDLRAAKPRPTAIVSMARSLATTGEFDHPALDGPGWWEREERNTHNRRGHARLLRGRTHYQHHSTRPLLITGATGTLGQAFAHACEIRGLGYRLLSRRELDIADEQSVARSLERYQPWAVINTAGYVRVRDAESDAQRCRRENTLGPATLAQAAHQRGIPLVTFSSDLVFDGQGGPYVESDKPHPLTVYGLTKAEAEQRVLTAAEKVLLVRTSAFFSPWDEYNFLHTAAAELKQGRRVVVPAGERVSPTYLPDLVRTTLDLLIDESWGLWHLANNGEISWRQLGQWVAEEVKAPRHLVVEEPSWIPPQVPRCLALKSERADLMPKLETALERYLEEVREIV
jgi:dTDP-4-dehydrorhamnose reductase